MSFDQGNKTMRESLSATDATAPLKSPTFLQSFSYATTLIFASFKPVYMTSPARCHLVASVQFPVGIAIMVRALNRLDDAPLYISVVAILFGILQVFVLAVITWFALGGVRRRLQATAPALETLSTGITNKTIVATSKYIIFFPCSKEELSSKTTTLVEKALFYIPGLYVDYRSYSRIAQALADKHNVLVVLMNSEPIRISLPVFGFDTAYMTSIIDEVETDWNLQVKEWSIGGHSLGTIASSNMSLDSDFPKKIKKVVMHAGFWNPDKSLQSSPLKFLILNATNDGFYFDSDQAKQNYLSCYPPDGKPNMSAGGQTVYMEMEGANHSGYGDYAPHQVFTKVDGKRTISLEEQHKQVLQITADFLYDRLHKVDKK